MKKKIIIAIMTILGGSLAFGQSRNLSHFYEPAHNVAALSTAQEFQVFLTAQHSLVGFEGAPKNLYLGGVYPILSSTGFINKRNNSLGEEWYSKHFVGASVSTSSRGVHNNIRALASYAYRFWVGETASFTLGLSAGVDRITSNLSLGNLQPEADPLLGSVRRATMLAVQYGIRFNYDRLSVSAYSDHTEYTGEMVWGKLYNYTRDSEKKWFGQVSLAAKYNRVDGKTQLLFGAAAVYKNGLSLGVQYGSPRDLSANISLGITPWIRLGYSYQIMQASTLTTSHAVSIKYSMKKVERRD